MKKLIVVASFGFILFATVAATGSSSSTQRAHAVKAAYVVRDTEKVYVREEQNAELRRVIVHRRVVYNYFWHDATASWYGPGFYGGPLACGGRLEPGMVGVANKTIPCGVIVTFKYRGSIVRAPVIDRGPYVAGRDFDLTDGLKAELGCPDLCYLEATRTY